jgi:hypothetical protein
MTLLTVDEFREHVATSLVDDAIQRLLDDAEAEITAYAGPLGSAVTELVDGREGRPSSCPGRLGGHLDHRDARDDRHRPGDRTTGASGRLRPRAAQHRHERALALGGLVTVVYTPDDDTASRKMVQLEL